MNTTSLAPDVLATLARLENELQTLAALSLDPCTDDEIVELTRRLEAARRASTAIDHRIVDQVNTRSIAYKHGCKSTADFIARQLRLRPAEATARVKAADRLGTKIAPSGAPVEPIYPAVAAAQAAGDISSAHAQIIIRMIEALPPEIAAEHDREAETFLVEKAHIFDPHDLGVIAERLRYTLDQDGAYHDETEQRRRSRFDYQRRSDGTVTGSFEGTSEFGEHLELLMAALAQPAPAADGQRDPRTASQRRHDALLDFFKLVEKAQLLPRTGGVTATIVLHMDAESFGTGEGQATTGFGYGIPADMAMRWAGDNARVIAVMLSKTRRVEAYSSFHRIFDERQRFAMSARDFGCTSPGCNSTLYYTEAHHVHEYQDTGQTTVDDGTLLCGYNHANFEAMGWQCAFIDGTPWWVPPAWLDPEQRPVQNQRPIQ